MATDTQTTSAQNDDAATLADRASELKGRAGALLHDGIDAVKNNPGTTAAVIGGVAAATAAYVGRDKIAETATALRDKVSSSNKPGSGEA